MDRFSPRLLCFWALCALPQLACTLITDVDRSKIPVPAIIEPDPVPPDAGAADAGEPSDAAGAATDASDAADAAPLGSDAGAVEPGDAQATPDGG